MKLKRYLRSIIFSSLTVLLISSNALATNITNITYIKDKDRIINEQDNRNTNLRAKGLSLDNITPFTPEEIEQAQQDNIEDSKEDSVNLEMENKPYDSQIGKEVKLSSLRVYIDRYRVPYVYECEGRHYVKMSFFKNMYGLGIEVFEEKQEDDVNYRIFKSSEGTNDTYANQAIMVQTLAQKGSSVGKIKATSKRVECCYKEYQLCEVDGSELIDLNWVIELYDGKYRKDESKNIMYIGRQTEQEISQLKAIDDPLYKEVLKCTKGKNSKLEYLKAFHNFVVLHLEYGFSKNDAFNPRNAIDAYNNKKGVCEAYAKLFKELCDRALIPCELVIGYAGESHMWNKVWINGQWLYVDCTFDDPVNYNDTINTMKYNYFLKKPGEMYSTHYWEGEDYKLPDYNESWKQIDGNNIQTQEQWRKYVVAQLRQKKQKFSIRAKNGIYGGIAFLRYYCAKNQILYDTITLEYDSGKGTYDVKCSYYR